MAEKSPAISPRRSVPASSFDFLNGSYQKTANARLATLAGFGVILVLVVLVILHGVNNMLAAGTAQEEADIAFGQRIEMSQQLTSVSSSGGLTEDEMNVHLKARSDAALKIATDAPPISPLLQSLEQVVPSGVTIQAITATPAEGSSSVAVTITANASSYDAIKPWEDAIASITYMRAEPLTWVVNSDNSVSLTTVATVSSPGETSQLTTIRSLLGTPAAEEAPEGGTQ